MRCSPSEVFDRGQVGQHPTIAPMQILRNAHFIARLVLVWFALSIGVAIASPIVKPQGLALICAGTGGMKLLAPSDDGHRDPGCNTLDCPLCGLLGAAPPPPATMNPLGSLQALNDLPTTRHTVHSGRLTAAPPPARGPPASLHAI
jgi:hypothetical protein